MTASLNCFSCGKEVQVLGRVGRRDECPACHADVHVCKNCEFYDPKVYNECRETTAEVVREKDRANYCDFFDPRKGSSGATSKADLLRAQAEALFKKS
jgi:hypothetical protein